MSDAALAESPIPYAIKQATENLARATAPSDRMELLRDAIQGLFTHAAYARAGRGRNALYWLGYAQHVIQALAVPGTFDVPDEDATALLRDLRRDALAMGSHGVSSIPDEVYAALAARLKGHQQTLLDWKPFARQATTNAPTTDKPRFTWHSARASGFRPLTVRGWRTRRLRCFWTEEPT